MESNATSSASRPAPAPGPSPFDHAQGLAVLPSGSGYFSSTRLPGLVNTKRPKLSGKQIAQRIQAHWMGQIQRLVFDEPDADRAAAMQFPPYIVAAGTPPPPSGQDDGWLARATPLAEVARTVDRQLGRMLSLPGAAASANDATGQPKARDHADADRLGCAQFMFKHREGWAFLTPPGMEPSETLAGKLLMLSDIHDDQALQRGFVELLADARRGDVMWVEAEPAAANTHFLCVEAKRRGLTCEGVDLAQPAATQRYAEVAQALFGCVEVYDSSVHKTFQASWSAAVDKGLPMNILMTQLRNFVDGVTDRQVEQLPAARRKAFVEYRSAVKAADIALAKDILANAAERDRHFAARIESVLGAKDYSKRTIWFVVGMAHVRQLSLQFAGSRHLLVAKSIDALKRLKKGVAEKTEL